MTTKTNHPEFRTDLTAILAAILAEKDRYQASRAELAQLACESFFHAAEHGNATALTAIFNMVSQNDKLSFKAWVLKGSEFTDKETGKKRHFVKYDSDKGFQIITGVEQYRKGVFSIADVLAMTAFFDVAKAERAKLDDAEKLNKAIAASYDNLKTIAGRLEEHNIPLTQEQNDALVTLQQAFKALLPTTADVVVAPAKDKISEAA